MEPKVLYLSAYDFTTQTQIPLHSVLLPIKLIGNKIEDIVQ